MKAVTAFALLAAGVQAAPHYTFPKLAGTSDWSSVRQTANFQSNGPVTDVNSNAIRCYQRAAGGAPDTTDVKAGGQITWVAAPNIYHPGGSIHREGLDTHDLYMNEIYALSAYMAKVPSGKTAADFDGSGAVWFKVYQDMPTASGGQYTWPSNGKSQIAFTIPQCLADGEYLFRIEHVALHSASAAGGAQFYISCAQVRVSGGSGSAQPKELVSFPGAYKATDPGIMINIYNNGGKTYQPAGPGVFSC
ncbi:glycoside hydrolase family 61 protein [Annulohypoxylon maeteangense]|uniref:glycoside hydrolase family 61 protein n=1 Tax=Annulohypoxylon maeteangense TaxID=1927788 RepID=UPI0020078BFB|nr:glycoside hydrolase family 61 protein [Annulohypoxylon maeteangense]KAI0883430.1 glycoside hydrolase family 61 protein [Annulohypoxylon maeteangense]